MKAGFYVSRIATRLKKFLNHVYETDSGLLKKIDFIVSDNLNDIDLKIMCEKYNIYFEYLNLENVKAKNLYSSNHIFQLMTKRDIDYLFIYCDSILKGDILNKYKNRIINFHPSLLPAHRGLMAIDQALNENSFLIGNTAHFVDYGIDTGPVIMQSILSANNFKNYDQVLDLQIPMIRQIFYWLIDGRLRIIDNKVIIEGGDYTISSFIPNIEFNYYPK